MNEAASIRPEFKFEPIELENIHNETLLLADDFNGSIGEMLSSQPHGRETSLIRVNLIAQIEKFYREEFPGIDKLSEAQRINLLSVLQSELRAFLELPRTPEGFIEGQLLIDRYLFDSARGNDTGARSITAEELATGQREIMKHIDLSEYEEITSDTAQTLAHLIPAIYNPMMLATAKNPGCLEIMEIGIGEGRIASALALLGHNIHGVDISPKALASLRARISNLKSSLESGTDNPQTAPVNRAFQSLGLDFDSEARANIPSIESRITVKEGDFFDEAAYEDIPDGSLDACTVMWHTFGFAGNRETQMSVLTIINRKLRPGGQLLIEMPDPNFGPYAAAIDEFDQKESEKTTADSNYKRYPRGTIIDAPSSNAKTPTSSEAETVAIRYFPDFPELAEVLTEADFILSNVEPYFVRSRKPEGGETLIIKEGLFIAEKPFTREQIEHLDHDAMHRFEIDPPHAPMDPRKRPGWFRNESLREPLPPTPENPSQG